MAELGAQLEAEIREQPDAWRRLAQSPHAAEIAERLRGNDVVLLGSGSSLFVASLGALALHRRGVRATALAATEAGFHAPAFYGAVVIAISQSGRSTDVLTALDRLRPSCVVALTNDAASPLAQRADVVVDIAAGREIAVPATKSVTTTAALLLWAAALAGGQRHRSAQSLADVADHVEAWLREAGPASLAEVGQILAQARSVAVLGAGYGVPIAYELALKIKESSYVHAEGFAAGEFRHGSAAMLDASCAVVGIVDEPSRAIVERPLAEAARAGSARYTVGGTVAGIARLGPIVDDAFNTLAWLVVGQALALEIGRARGVDSDAPRGLRKFVV